MVRIRIAKRPAAGRVAKRSKLNSTGKQQEIAPWGSSSDTSNKTRLKRNSSGLTAHVSPRESKAGCEDSDAAVAMKVMGYSCDARRVRFVRSMHPEHFEKQLLKSCTSTIL